MAEVMALVSKQARAAESGQAAMTGNPSETAKRSTSKVGFAG